MVLERLCIAASEAGEAIGLATEGLCSLAVGCAGEHRGVGVVPPAVSDVFPADRENDFWEEVVAVRREVAAAQSMMMTADEQGIRSVPAAAVAVAVAASGSTQYQYLQDGTQAWLAQLRETLQGVETRMKEVRMAARAAGAASKEEEEASL